MQLQRLNTILGLILLTTTQAFAQNDSTVAVTELARMNMRFGHNVRMTIEREGPNVSLLGQEIKFSLSELKRISNVTQKSIRLYIVRFIVAHEFAHQMQYLHYQNNPKFMNNDRVSRTLLETQADILAGIVFQMMSEELLTYTNTHPELVKNIYKELFQVAYDLGVRENTLGSHPSKRDRMLAMKLGISNGLSFVYDVLVKADPIRARNLGITPASFENQMTKHFQYLDLNKNEDMMAWSYRQAKKIVNYDRKVSTGIILTTPVKDRTKFHEDAAYPFVDYNLTYKNVSNRSIDTEMEIFVAMVQRGNTEEVQNYRKLSVRHYKFTLAPGQSNTISGKLSWSKNDDVFFQDFDILESEMPRIVYPGAERVDGIYSCSYSDDQSEQVYQAAITELKFNDTSSDARLQSFFNSLLTACLGDNLNAIWGIGEASQEYPGEITYASSIQLGDNTQTLITLNTAQHVVVAEVAFPNYYPNKDKMAAKYQELKDQLDQILISSNSTERLEGDFKRTEYRTDRYGVNLITIPLDGSKVYTISIQLYLK